MIRLRTLPALALVLLYGTVTGGLMKGAEAQLQIAGTSYEGKKITGDRAMKKVAGNWRVIDMSLNGDE
jgi:hypothetical protein